MCVVVLLSNQNQSTVYDKVILPFFIVLVFLFAVPQVSFSQVSIQGKLLNEENIDGVHIVNSTSKTYTVTNSEGEFEIQGKRNDTIKIIAIAFLQKEIVISAEIIEKRYFEVLLNDAVNQLDEVVVGSALTGELKKDMLQAEIQPDFSLNLSWGQIKDIEFPQDPKAPLINIATDKGKVVDGLNVKNIIGLLISPLMRKKPKAQFKSEQLETFSKEYVINYFGEDVFEIQFLIPEDKIELFLIYCWENNELQSLFNDKKDFELLEKLVVLSKEFHALPKD